MKERQRFMRKGLVLIIVLTVAGLLFILFAALYRTIVLGKLTGLSVFNDADLALLVFFILLSAVGLPLIFYAIRMDMQLKDGILYARFWPFKDLNIPLDQIVLVEKVRLNAKEEFGGLGIRENLQEYALVMLANDYQAILIVLKNGDRFLFSSRRADDWIKQLRKA
jgi:hypothetical protein